MVNKMLHLLAYHTQKGMKNSLRKPLIATQKKQANIYL